MALTDIRTEAASFPPTAQCPSPSVPRPSHATPQRHPHRLRDIDQHFVAFDPIMTEARASSNASQHLILRYAVICQLALAINPHSQLRRLG